MSCKSLKVNPKKHRGVNSSLMNRTDRPCDARTGQRSSESSEIDIAYGVIGSVGLADALHCVPIPTVQENWRDKRELLVYSLTVDSSEHIVHYR